jgi:hypothetical protein
MNRRTEETAVIIILVVFILVPFGLVVLFFPAQPFYTVSGKPVHDASQAAGITIVRVTNITWPIAGSTGGRSYVLANQAGNTVNIQTQSFDSAESRDAAIQVLAAQSVGKGRTIGTLIVIGNHLVYVGPDPGGILNQLGPELRKIQSS